MCVRHRGVAFVQEKASAGETNTADDREASRYFKTSDNWEAAGKHETSSGREAPTDC